MANFNYTAVNELGRTVRGVVIADNELDLEARLKQLGLELIAASEARQRTSGRFSRIRLRDMVVLCLHLEQLDRAGVPLHEALADVRDSTESPKLKDVLTGVYESIKNGTILSEALAAYPRVFSDVFVGLIAAGERTGNLSSAFQHVSDHLKWTDHIHRKIKKASRYPMVLLVIIALVITTMMLAVVPKLVDFIVNQGFDIPIHTRALIAVSAAFADYWYLMLGMPVLLLVGVILCYRASYAFAYKVDRVTLKVPVIGDVVRKIDLARFTHFFSVMFNSGIDVLESLDAAKGVIGNRVIRETVDVVRTNVMEGNSLTNSLRLSNQFPNLVVRMFKVGEDSGNMSEALENINFFYDREVNDSVDTMIGFIQPALTVVMGSLIFWIIAAIFGPLYQSFSKMQF